MRVIGTAGHVDHGKSALIEALTGTHPDRLQEERERGLTIVLGFAWLTLPNGNEIGIVDVPGHRDFIENMLSGIGAIDACLFVVAADESVMPQTREHLAILDLLQIGSGVIALTKIDLVDDPDWLDLVEAEIRETLEGTVLDGAPMVRVSARTGEGIGDLQQSIEDVLSDKPPRVDLGRPRLCVDRVFTIAGFGTVVTGTLTEGRFQVGDDIVVLPENIKGRIRGLQTHQSKIQSAIPGSRTAINISGINIDQVQRGAVIAHIDDYQTTRRIDVHFRMLANVKHPLRHNTPTKFFIGASEVIARVRLLGVDVLNPGDEGWLQLELISPVVAVRGDRYILRRPSPAETMGGGVVIDPQPKGRHKRFDQIVLERIDALKSGSAEDIFLQALLVLGVASFSEVTQKASLTEESAIDAFNALIDGKQIILLTLGERLSARTLLSSSAYWGQLLSRAVREMSEYHLSFPLRMGMPREELKSRLQTPIRIFNALLVHLTTSSQLTETAVRQNLPGVSALPVVHLTDHRVRFSSEQQKKVDLLMDKFKSKPYSPPTIKDCLNMLSEDLYNALIDSGSLMPVSSEVVFRWQDYQNMVSELRTIFTEFESVQIAQVRDHFNTTRRYVLA
ncbi:MAG: selenocysteine-specific translation elongation factor, partial [Anaerolineae bacterium]|nr:selenocysteine-specific translation elongation factor [Anaerolineae bacterium]